MEKVTSSPHYRRALQEAVTLENGVLLLALLIAGSLLWSTVGALQRNYELQREVDVKQQETELLSLETQNLQYRKRYFQSPEYAELSARQNLGLVANGEKVIILPKHADAVPAPAVSAVTADDKTNFQQWLYFFFGHRSQQS